MLQYNGLFVTGTDTDVGKTYVACLLLKYFNQQGYKTLGVKPMASGATWGNGQLWNDDALKLQAASSVKKKYHIINPFCLERPIAPHIAAKLNKTIITCDMLCQYIHDWFEPKIDLTLIEGVGGWKVPLNDKETMEDFAIRLQKPVVLVVRIQLGAINHALLTYQAIKASQVPILGWFANGISVMGDSVEKEIINTLRNSMIDMPFLGWVDQNGMELKLTRALK